MVRSFTIGMKTFMVLSLIPDVSSLFLKLLLTCLYDVVMANTIYLMQQGNVGMDGPLIDREGYPRADIDVYTVRKARQRIICKYQDMFTKWIMDLPG